MKETQGRRYGVGDTTFQAAGGETGIRRLVDTFFDLMGSTPAYQTIWSWHPTDKESSRDKLARFLCGWTGGPKRYHEKYGSISIPKVHAHLNVTAVEKDQWLSCMSEALAQQPYHQSLIDYLLTELAVPAEHIRRHCAENIAAGSGRTDTIK